MEGGAPRSRGLSETPRSRRPGRLDDHALRALRAGAPPPRQLERRDLDALYERLIANQPGPELAE